MEQPKIERRKNPREARSPKFKELVEAIQEGDCEPKDIDKAFEAGEIEMADRDRLGYIGFKATAGKDHATELFNKMFCKKRVREAIDRLKDKRKSVESVMVVFLDINNFKEINTQYGHDNGDVIIREVGDVLLGSTGREEDLKFHWGGDEFLILLEMSITPENKFKIEDIISSIRAKVGNMNFKINHEGKELNVPVQMAIGHEVMGQDTKTTAEDIFKIANTKMYRDKAEQKESVAA